MTRRVLWRFFPLGLAIAVFVAGAADWPTNVAAATNGAVFVTIAGDDGRPIAGLTAADFAVRVAGHDLAVVSAEPATDPVSLIVFVQVMPNDVSLTRAALRSLLDSVRRASPHARIGLAFGSGDPEMLAVTAQAQQLDRVVGMLYQEPDLGPLVERLPGLAAVLSKEPSRRRIILSITPPGVTNGLRVGPETGASLQAAGCELWGIEVAPVGSTVLDRDTIFEDLISRSGGRRATVYGAALLDTVVRQAAELFLSQYLVTYTHPDAKGPLPLRVGVRGLRQGAQIFAPGWTID